MIPGPSPTPTPALDELSRLLVKPILLVSLYLLFKGHNAPGGGFAGGLVASSAWVLRLLAGGPRRLSDSLRISPVALIGAGLLVALVTAAVPLVAGSPMLSSAIWEADLPTVGHVKLVSSTFFDIGVYLVVIGVVVTVLTRLGEGDEEEPA